MSRRNRLVARLLLFAKALLLMESLMNSPFFISRRRFAQGMAMGAASLIGGCTSRSSAKSTDVNETLTLEQFIAGMPKAELHVHLEGTVEPAVAMKIAARNRSATPYDTVEKFEAALNFDSLASFLEAFHNTIAVLKTEEDFYDITHDYLAKCHAQNIVHVDLKFDPQAHQRRGIEYGAFFNGIRQAQLDAQRELGISSQLIMCFQRDASLESAEAAYAEALKHREHIIGVGLDNTEVLNFPVKFAGLFSRARKAGFKLTSHCDLGQPNTVEHIRACIEDLKVDRLDHGYNVLEDERLVQIALDTKLCFTACPTSAYNTTNHSERFYFREVCRSIEDMLNLGLRVTLNTDDPGVMGNRQLTEVIADAANFLDLDHSQVAILARNAFEGLWVPDDQKRQYLVALSEYESTHS